MTCNSRQHTITALMIGACLIAGCRGGVYDASTLPPELAAPVVRSTERLDLSKLARTNLRSDLVQPGDVLRVTITTGWDRGEPAEHFLRVGRNGMLDIPLIGSVPVAGRELTEAEQAIGIAGVQADVYRAPQVSIHVEQRRINKVTVLGAVETPGVYEVPASHSDLLAALVAAGGLREDAATTVEVQHSLDTHGYPTAGPTVQPAGFQASGSQASSLRIDLSQASAVPATQLAVHDGTVVMVPQRSPQTIYVMGLVKKADQYELPPDEDLRLLDAVALAGGRTMELADKVRIIRKAPQYDTAIVIQASIRDAERSGADNIRLAAGDVVHVEETPMTFTIEMLRSFIRFGFSSAIPGF